jgi:hypothetical protein
MQPEPGKARPGYIAASEGSHLARERVQAVVRADIPHAHGGVFARRHDPYACRAALAASGSGEVREG